MIPKKRRRRKKNNYGYIYMEKCTQTPWKNHTSFPFLLGGLRVCACACSMCIRHHTARSVPELRKLCVSPILPQVSTLQGITHVSLSRRRVSVAIKVSRIVTSMRYTARGTPPAVFVRGRGISRGGEEI